MAIQQVKVQFLDKFEIKVADVNKKLKRAGKELVTSTKVGEEQYQLAGPLRDEYPVVEGQAPRFPLEPIYTRHILEVSIPEMFAGIEGWEFVAKIEFLSGGNVVTSPGEKIEGVDLEKYASIKPFCHHCNARRPRQKSLVFRNTTTMEEIQIGTSCASLYFGMDLESNIKMFEFLSNFLSSCASTSEEEDDYYGRHSQRTMHFNRVMFAALYMVKKYGFVGKKAADAFRKQSTVDAAWSLAFPISDQAAAHKRVEEAEFFTEETQKLLATEIEAFYADTHTVSLTGLGDFDRNAIIAIRSCSEKHLAFAVPYMKNYFEIKNQQFEKKLESFYLGEIGKKISEVAKIETIRDISGEFDRWLIKFRTAAGSQITWFASSRPDFSIQEGDEVLVEGKVKDHNEYKGIKSTIITRASLSKEYK